MTDKEKKHKTDLKGEVKYDQHRVMSGRSPHNLSALEDEKYKKAISEKEGNL